jgi:hypothetical protein
LESNVECDDDDDEIENENRTNYSRYTTAGREGGSTRHTSLG